MRCPSLGVSSPFVKLHLKEGYGSPAPHATDRSESISLWAQRCCRDCAALTLFSIDHRLGENNLRAANNQAALLLAAATPEWKDGQLPHALPFSSCAVFTCHANLSCQTQLQTQNRSYLNFHFSSRLEKSDFSQAVQQKELYLSGSYSSLPIMPWTTVVSELVPDGQPRRVIWITPSHCLFSADSWCYPHLARFFFFNVLTLVLKRKDLS